MFLETAKFKKAAKAAYDGPGLNIIHHTNGTIQAYGGGWFLAVHETDITKKCMAALVELAPDKVDRGHNEPYPGPPVLFDNMVIYSNGTMQFAIIETPVHNSGERDFLRMINGKDMAWPYED